MSASIEHTHYLIAARLAGNASDAELRELDSLINTNDAVKKQWHSAINGIAAEDIDTHFSRIDNWTWKDMTEMQPKRRAGGKILAWGGILAAAAITGIVIAIQIFKADVNPNPSPNTAIANNKTVELQLGNGRVFALSGNTNTHTYGAGTLQNSGATLTYTVDKTKGGEEVLTAINSLKVPIGMDYKIVLSDGSTVWLNSQTVIKFPFKFGATSREISVNGEAFLEVTKDPARPFFVRTSRGAVQVLGTSFNVNTYDSGVVKVALVEGAVRFKTKSSETTIKPGWEAVYRNEAVGLKPFDQDVTLAWRTGRLYFENATIQEITNVLPRWFGVEVQFDNPSVKTDTFTGVVNRNKPITIFLDKLKKIMGIDYYFDKKGILHIK